MGQDIKGFMLRRSGHGYGRLGLLLDHLDRPADHLDRPADHLGLPAGLDHPADLVDRPADPEIC